MFSHDENSAGYSECDTKYGNCNKAYSLEDYDGALDLPLIQLCEESNIEYSTSNAPWVSKHNNDCTNVLIENIIKPKSMARWFYNLYILDTIDGTSNINTSECIDMSAAFCGCRVIKTLDLSSWDTSNVRDMANMFSICWELNRIDGISNFNTSSLTNFSLMFNDCKKITSLDLDSWDTSKVGISGYGFEGIFNGCISLETLKIANFNPTGDVVYINSMFRDCNKLTTLDLSSFTVKNNMIASYMFKNCNNLRTVTYGSNFGKPKKYTDMYSNCPANKPSWW